MVINMAIYDAEGNQLYHAYDAEGNELAHAYDAEGNAIFSRAPIILKAMTYNVGGWYIGSGTNVPTAKDAEYYALQYAMIQNADADILCIPEYWDTFSETGRTALSLLSQFYPYIETRNGDTQYYGRAICSKFPITNYVVNNYTNQNRYYDKATVNIGGINVSVLVTLPTPHDADTRKSQIKQLFDYVKNEEYMILCGDFNTVMNDATDQDYINNYPQFIENGDHLANGGEFGFFNTHAGRNNLPADGGCLDQIITSAKIQITAVSTDQTKYNDGIDDYVDHIPLIANLSIGN